MKKGILLYIHVVYKQDKNALWLDLVQFVRFINKSIDLLFSIKQGI